MVPTREIKIMQQDLLRWYAAHRRDLPWRRTSDPYAIWISEIMLQQTRVQAVLPYYERFLARFPDFRSLAGATESDLLSHWAGLGYYYRARNMQKAAKTMMEQGSFPATYEGIRALAGIGDYTAAAIASIAFNHPHAAVDGNVMRVLSRVLADGTEISSGPGKRRFSAAANSFLAEREPGAFNQAMMELGATICLPRNPQCLVCPISSVCRARQTGRQHEFPVKLKPAKSLPEERQLFWIERRGKVLLWQRPDHSRLMPGFWELPEAAQLPGLQASETLGTFRHGITVHDYRFEVLAANPPESIAECRWVELSEIPRIPASTILKKAGRVVERRRRSLEASEGVAAG